MFLKQLQHLEDRQKQYNIYENLSILVKKWVLGVTCHMGFIYDSVQNWHQWKCQWACIIPSSSLWFHVIQWRHKKRNGVSNHQPHDCFLKRFFRCKTKKTSKLHVTGLCEGNSPVPVNSPHKGPVTRKLLPFDDVVMIQRTDTGFREYQYYLAKSQTFISFLSFCHISGW